MTNSPSDNRFAKALRAKRFRRLAAWLLLPLALPQGFAVRAAQPRLLPPLGLWQRAIGQGQGAPVRLLILGDSSVAGVGVAKLEEGLAVQIAQALAEKSKRQIALRMAAANSATSADLRDWVVPNLPRDAFDIVLLVVGMNDAKNLHTSRRFLKTFGSLAYALRSRFPSAVIAHWPIAPMSIFPVLPQPLKTLLKIRSDRIDGLAACLCAERGLERFERRMTFPQDGFARDGFHVNEAGCAIWADDVADALLANLAVREKLTQSVDEPMSGN